MRWVRAGCCFYQSQLLLCGLENSHSRSQSRGPSTHGAQVAGQDTRSAAASTPSRLWAVGCQHKEACRVHRPQFAHAQKAVKAHSVRDCAACTTRRHSAVVPCGGGLDNARSAIGANVAKAARDCAYSAAQEHPRSASTSTRRHRGSSKSAHHACSCHPDPATHTDCDTTAKHAMAVPTACTAVREKPKKTRDGAATSALPQHKQHHREPHQHQQQHQRQHLQRRTARARQPWRSRSAGLPPKQQAHHGQH